MKRKVILSITVIALLLGGACLLYFPRPAPLPRIRFSDGGEFRVVQICYGGENDHHHGGAPGSLFWLWEHLPKQLQKVIPYPNTGVGGLSPFPNTSAISIWWAYIDPGTHKAELGPTDYVITTLDSGERLGRIWPSPADDYRQIFLHDPPRHSKHLHFQLAAEDHPVEFSIENPAFDDSDSTARRHPGGSPNPRDFPIIEIPVFPEGEQNVGLEVQTPECLALRKEIEEFEFEYSIVNFCNADVFVATEPRDNIADSFPAFHGGGRAQGGRLRYSLVRCPEGTDGKRVACVVSRKALMTLRNPLESGGRFHLCIYVEGYFRDTGQRFFGSTYIDLPVTIVE